MSVEIKVPTFPESVADGTILRWNKQPGETVARDETLVEIETDKVVFEVPAPAAGVLEGIEQGDGEVVTSGQVIGRLNDGATAGASTESAPSATAAGANEAQGGTEPPVSPSARRLLEAEGLEVSQVSGSGKGGRILKEDVERHLAQKQGGATAAVAELAPDVPAAAPRAAEQPSRTPQAPTQTPAPTAPGEREEKRVPMTRLRARVAERLLAAQHDAAILTTFNEVNMQPVMQLRQRYREAFEKRHGVKLGFMSFFVKAAVEALRRFPEVNASIDGNDIVYHGYFDIGIAVSSPRGLVVPILRDADNLDLAGIENRILDFARRAKEGRLELDEITGGTFTITNGGVFGSMLSTPIINPPQSGILGMHKIQERPVAENGEIVIRPMMYLALSYDHRLVDGREAVQFLVTIKDMIEDPARLLLDV
ncbi:2-oxoglutarate dehydrogenase complex dihydrolipoyllysine-residue succinyltransferase [Thiohalobacter thiocyanaticus]|uniref:Dihydrolipoyllysine-residue succinyltransferase component of 2-oxoglutarate dehydrogenase complex n=1 Tax=Thiohalobacter thiocyanaticus TaxID=585455 RepID=A0A426QFM9_9GAMM|nr:2-oxoglutarate dehydrogenase complex dihydrolipoyllysine-residue succinyltransferase [Thiohalobacter thiocyanaticus]RRQ20548.1 2-oxoglutarate dehydrogenase complex dihydrolipoyllysine-residue succinyltransferase [Thiohalobacter thiocyanaticus]